MAEFYTNHAKASVEEHIADTDIHVTSEDKAKWNTSPSALTIVLGGTTYTYDGSTPINISISSASGVSF